MTERPPENIGNEVLGMIDRVVGAIKLLIEPDVGPVDDNGEATRIDRLDNLFDRIIYLRAGVERLLREYHASLDSVRGTILLAIRQAENGTRPLSVPIAVQPVIVVSQQWQELHAATTREIINQVFGGLVTRVRWEPSYYTYTNYLGRRTYRNPGAIDESDDEASLFSSVNENADGNESTGGNESE